MQEKLKNAEVYAVCHFGSFRIEKSFSHNLCVEKALVAANWKVVECRVENRMSTDSRVRSFTGLADLLSSIPLILSQSYGLWRKHLSTPDYDILIVGYPAHVDVFLGSVLAAWSGRPIVMDAFLGLYDTVVRDRRLISERNPIAWIIRAWEWMALHLADIVMIDTPEHAEMLAEEYGLARDRLISIPVGVDETLWRPSPLPEPIAPFRVGLWTSFIPLHGVEFVIEAARILDQRGEAIQFEIIGDGQTAPQMRALLDQARIENLVWRQEYVPIEDVFALAKRSDCCLGILGTTEKAGRVVPYKVYQALAIGRPLVTADTPAVRRGLRHGARRWPSWPRPCPRCCPERSPRSPLAARHPCVSIPSVRCLCGNGRRARKCFPRPGTPFSGRPPGHGPRR